jgi:hypothetical protein
VKVRFVAQEQPHGDELTLVSVELRGGGLDACSTVESLAGDYGVKAKPVRQRGDVTSPGGSPFAGLMALVRARDAAAEAGVAFRVRAPSPLLRRIAEFCGYADLLGAE